MLRYGYSDFIKRKLRLFKQPQAVRTGSRRALSINAVQPDTAIAAASLGKDL